MINLEQQAGDLVTKIQQMIDLYRVQNYYSASHMEIEFIDEVSSFIKSMAEQGFVVLCETLQNALQAKTQYNEVVVADYYEEILLPTFYSIIESMREQSIEESYFQQNMEIVQKRFPELYTKLCAYEMGTEEKVYEIETTKSGMLTLSVVQENSKKVYLHSNNNPVTEAIYIAKEYYEEVDSKYGICGFGLGYLAEAMISMDSTSEIIVYESDLEVLLLALNSRDLRELLSEERLQIRQDENYMMFCKNIGVLNPVIHYPSIEIMKNEQQKEKLKDCFIQLQSVKNQRIRLEENFSRNIKLQDESVDVLKEVFQNKKMLLLAGGPSLDSCMEWIAQHKQGYVVVSVGTVLQKLCEYGIIPDYAIVTDANLNMIQQIKHVDTTKVPLMYMVTASHLVREQYKGKAYRILQKGWPQSEEYAKANGLEVYRTGGSVTTTALDIGISFGCSEIFCMGMDMAYTGGVSHAKGTAGCRKQNTNERMIQVPGVKGEMVYSVRNLCIYRKWIERRIEECENIRFINVSNGAFVQGMKNISVDEFLELY